MCWGTISSKKIMTHTEATPGGPAGPKPVPPPPGSLSHCHQKYSTLRFRPSPSEIVLMTLSKLIP